MWLEIYLLGLKRTKDFIIFNIQYYNGKSPSARKTPKLGHCLTEPKVEIFDEDFKTIKWR